MWSLKTIHPGSDLEDIGMHEISNYTGGRPTDFNNDKELMDEICELCAQMDLPVGLSRIQSYRKAMQELRDAWIESRPLDNSLQISVSNTLVDAHELRIIFSAATRSQDINLWRPHLKKLMSGSHPKLVSKILSVWDFQYEAFLAGVMQLSGISTTFAEPDIVINDPLRTIGIAVKRPHSLKNFNKLLKKASNQIKNTGLSGIIALDISLVIGTKFLLRDSLDQDGSVTVARIIVDEFIKNHYVEIKDNCGGEHIIGVLLTLNLPVTYNAADKSQSSVYCVSRWQIIATANDFAATGWLVELANKCSIGLFGSHFPKNDKPESNCSENIP